LIQFTLLPLLFKLSAQARKKNSHAKTPTRPPRLARMAGVGANIMILIKKKIFFFACFAALRAEQLSTIFR
jgi:hypothetical protein